MNNKILDSELFWVSHPNSYVSMYMKYDWFQMDRAEFMAKYAIELHTSKLEEKKAAIAGVIKSIWSEMENSEKYLVLSLISQGKHVADTFQYLITLVEAMDCKFMDIAIQRTYNVATGRNYDTNYLTSYGINPAI